MSRFIDSCPCYLLRWNVKTDILCWSTLYFIKKCDQSIAKWTTVNFFNLSHVLCLSNRGNRLCGLLGEFGTWWLKGPFLSRAPNHAFQNSISTLFCSYVSVLANFSFKKQLLFFNYSMKNWSKCTNICREGCDVYKKT